MAQKVFLETQSSAMGMTQPLTRCSTVQKQNERMLYRLLEISLTGFELSDDFCALVWLFPT